MDKIILAEHLTNRFINYYIIKWIWLRYDKNVNDLYLTFFPDKDKKKGNRTLYDRILRLDEFDLQDKVKELPQLTGLHLDYFLGTRALKVEGLLVKDWEYYIQLREKDRKKEKSLEQEDAKNKIEVALLHLCHKNKDNQTQSFKIISEFIKTGNKVDNDTIESKMNKIEKLVGEFTRSGLFSMGLDQLKEYELCIKKHLSEVQATIILRNFK